MSRHDYQMSKALDVDGATFAAHVMAAMRRADTGNAAKLRAAFPNIAAELEQRYWAPGAYLPGEQPDTARE